MKLKDTHFEYFVEEARKWLRFLGLLSWSVDYEFDNLEESYADCLAHYSSRRATIRLNREFPQDYEKEDLKDVLRQCALHEVLELLLSPVIALAGTREYDETDFRKETHCVIRTLENILL